MIRLLMAILLIASTYAVKAQTTLFMPRNIERAYQRGTRSLDGKPGKNYWQNHGIYNITVTVNPPDKTVRGTETITYFNNSPDTLRVPVIKLIQNIHKAGTIRFVPAGDDYLTGGVQIDKLTIDGKQEDWAEPVYTHPTIRLEKPLPPKGAVTLTFDWHYEISGNHDGREGALDSTSYFLAYFYPRVAVYDDCHGWDRMDFTDEQEFYNDFNDYTLTVKAPKNYIVWATGTLQNTNEVLQPKYAKRLERSMTTDSILHIATTADLATKKVTAQNDMNAWKWTADNITDVTCAISDHYVWDASSVIVDDATKRRASVQAAYKDSATDFHYMVGFGRHALSWLSKNWPGVAYPFPKTTIVQGFADMEYPMMVNDNTNADTTFTRFVVEHELAHTWFPFYMGINEHRYGFMDEGWATTFELLIGRNDMGVAAAEEAYKNFRITYWIHDPNDEEQIPIMTPGNALSGIGLGNNEYGKASLGYLAVKDLLGDDMFRKCLHAYMDRWHGKHPTPWDFYYTFNDVSGKNLDWFWNNWFFGTGYIDLAIQNVTANANGYAVTLNNIGGYVAPADLLITYADGTEEKLHQTPAIWENNLSTATVNISTSKKINTIMLDGGIFMDADMTNNKWTAQ
ncbi:MAG TPA: M1 family metallopeptidase [Ferruginibacter sp.]|nr:M1 family metallopeptidase [Ferruginibacter sp.]